MKLVSNPTVISLFTGAGALDLGFEQAGFDVRVCVEIDPITCGTLRNNRPNWKVIQNDIVHMSTRQILEVAGLSRGEATVITGGPPCQPFSTLGNRKALEDPRGRLVREFLRVVKEARPEAFLFENVPGLKSVKNGRVISEILSAMESIGYSPNLRILNSANYGVPQVRKRLFILGRRDGIKLDFPAEDHSQDGTVGEKWVTVKEAFEELKNVDPQRKDNLRFRHSREMIDRMRLVRPGKNFWSLPLDRRPNCWKNGKHLGRDTFGRIEAERPAPTIRTCAYNPTKGRYIHPFEDRGLNTLEMAVLQTFPSDYLFEGGLISVGKQIGDAVPPLLSYKIATRILEQLRNAPVQPILSTTALTR